MSTADTDAVRSELIVLRAGAKIRFAEESKRYTIRAASQRFGVCTRPSTKKDRKEFEYEGSDSPPIYMIVDLERMERGVHNLVLNPFDFETDAGCLECLDCLESGDCELSRRTYKTIPLVLSE